MENTLFRGKSTRTKIYTVITAVAICLILCLNMGLSYVCGYNLVIADLTPEGFYTLSDKMLEVCHGILDTKDGEQTKQIKITFCTDRDYLTSSDTYRATYFMALALQKEFDNVSVEVVNASLNPTAVSMYKTTSRDSITASDIIVSYGSKYRIADMSTFWLTTSSTDERFSYNGEYRMASILASLTAVNQPAAYFTTDHSETYYDPSNPDSQNSKDMAAIKDLLEERGLKVKTLELGKVDEIPEDCVLLIINNPTEDFKYDHDRLDEYYYVSDTEKIDRYLVKKSGALIVNKSYDKQLPVLEEFLAEWGIGFSSAQLYDPDNTLFQSIGSENDDSTFTAVYDANEEDFGYAYYGSYADLSSAPKMVFSNTGYLYCTFDNTETMVEQGNKHGTRDYISFLGTSENAYNYVNGGTDRGKKTIMATAVRSNLDDFTAEREFAYIFCTNSADFFSNELLGNPSYANYEVMASVITNISRTDRYATTDLGGTTVNSSSVGGKRCVSTALSETATKILSADMKEEIGTNSGIGQTEKVIYTVLVMAIPVSVLVLGIVMFIKRKFL